jgi:hypothetical protein
MADLENALRMSKNRKSPGIDDINRELIKYASIKLTRFIQLLNDIWYVGRIPEEWKIARVVNTHKKGDKRRTETSEMRFLRSVLGVSLRDEIRSEEVRKQLNNRTNSRRNTRIPKEMAQSYRQDAS